jgi:hypothetical protein
MAEPQTKTKPVEPADEAQAGQTQKPKPFQEPLEPITEKPPTEQADVIDSEAAQRQAARDLAQQRRQNQQERKRQTAAKIGPGVGAHASQPAPRLPSRKEQEPGRPRALRAPALRMPALAPFRRRRRREREAGPEGPINLRAPLAQPSRRRGSTRIASSGAIGLPGEPEVGGDIAISQEQVTKRLKQILRGVIAAFGCLFSLFGPMIFVVIIVVIILDKIGILDLF